MATDGLTPRVRVVREHHLVKELALTGPLNVGRLPDNDIVIEDDLVSGHHGRIEKAGKTWRYVDLGSTNGSVVAAGPTLRGGEAFEILEDCQVLLGATVLDIRLEAGSTFILKRDAPPTDSSDSSLVAGKPIELPPTHPRLLVVQGGRAKTVEIGSTRVTIGRAGRSDVVVEDPSVSSRHAELRWDGSAWMLRDLASTNGTRIGIHKVTRARPVSNNDHISLGQVDLLFLEDGATAPDPAARLAALEEEGLISRSQSRQARDELASGRRQLGEILVGNGWLSPGQWSEAASDSTVTQRPAGRRFWWTLAALAALGLIAFGVGLALQKLRDG